MQSRAVGSIPGMPFSGEFVAAASRTTPRKCSPKRDPKVRVSRCHSSPTHPRTRKQLQVKQNIIFPEGKLRHGDKLGSLEVESRYVPGQKCGLGHVMQWVSTGCQTHWWTRRSFPGASSMTEAGVCRDFVGALPCCVFLASCEKTNKSLAGMIPAGSGREFTLAHRKYSFHIFWEGSKVSVVGSKCPVAVLAVPGPSVPSLAPNSQECLQLSVYL